MFCISISYKKTPLSIRQQFAFSKEEQLQFLTELLKKTAVTGGVIVSTCNRSEFYFSGNASHIEEIEKLLSDLKRISKENIKKYGLYYSGEKAVRHLYKVAGGLDSMVLGEDEILRQVKEAYLLANDNGFTDGELNIIFQGAFHAAKLSKSETRLSNTPVSIATLTANAVFQYRQTMAVPDSTSVLVIGATGEIGSIVVKDLLAKGIPVIGTSRKKHPAKETFLQSGILLKWLDFEKRYEAVKDTNVIVSATGSPHYTLTKEEFLAHKKVDGNYLLIDLAVPPDMDEELFDIPGITLYNIDYFQTLSRENSNIKLGEMEKAERILQDCIEEVLKNLYIRDFQKEMEGKTRKPWFWKMIYYLKEVLDSKQFFTVLGKIYEKEW